MENAIIKILYGKYSDLTYESDKYYHIDLLESEYQSVKGLVDFENGGCYEIFGPISVYAKYIGPSRIDRKPIFSVNLTSENRRNKIEEIIK